MEKFNVWHIFALVALIMWGLWGFFPKLTTKYIDPKSALVWEVVGSIIVGIIVLIIIGFKPAVHPKGVVFAILTGIFALLGALAFLYAISKGKASVVVTITALYPLVAIALSFFVLHEAVTIKQGIGILVALVAMILLVG